MTDVRQQSPVTLSYDFYEAAEPSSAATSIVIAHGLFGSSTNWRGIARKLRQQYNIYVVDLRNHGESPWHDVHDYPSLASDLRQFINTKIRGTCVVVGHSMGGKAVMQLALDQAEQPVRNDKDGRVEGIVVVDIAPVSYGHSHDGFIEAMSGIDVTALRSRSDADQQLAASIVEKPIRQFLLQNLVSDNGQYRWRINLSVLRSSMDTLVDFDAASRISTTPALFVYGTVSGYMDKRGLDAARMHFSKAQFVPVKGAGHWVHAEQPTLVIKAIDNFVDFVRNR